MQDNPNYSYIGTIKTPDGGTHYVKDAEARAAITSVENRVTVTETDVAALKESIKSGTHFLGKSTSPLTDRCTTNPIKILRGGVETTVTAKAGDFTVCETEVGTGTLGVEFLFDGTCWNELGSTGTLGSLAYKDAATGTFKPQGTVSKPTASTTPTSESVDHLTANVDADNETLVIGKVAKIALTDVAVDVSQPVFTGTEKTVSVS